MDTPQCMSMGQNGLFNYCHISYSIAAVSSTRQAEHVRNSQQNITTEWMPHSVCRWAKMDRSTNCHISYSIAAVSAPRLAEHVRYSLLNMMTERTPHGVCLWAKMYLQLSVTFPPVYVKEPKRIVQLTVTFLTQ